MERVIVGVDGSPQSIAALQVAAREAECRGTRVEAVYVYTAPHELVEFATVTGLVTVSSATDSPPAVHELRRERDRIAADVREHAEGRLRQFAELAGVEPDIVDFTVISDPHPSKVLLNLAKDAGLLVVGSRGLGAIKRRLLGSVSHEIVQHAPCSVLVVRSDEIEGIAATTA